ncbi:hypothetical protein [Marinobacter sp. X15-166B]|uniref:hypothetical protein n=1 Tax=Marinobacter sp. X15-166B TaxID=1897620 RepID=UPI000B2B038A|nr:hypothetical protein [Marinobacter sp. X15-166B]
MRATSGFLKGLNPTVTIASKVPVIGFVLFCAILAATQPDTTLALFTLFDGMATGLATL